MRQTNPRFHALFACSLLFLVAALVTGCGAAQTASPTPPPYQQTVTTSQFVREIHTGIGIDQNTHDLVGETGTFKVGQTMYVVFTGDVGGGGLDIHLVQGNTLVTQHKQNTIGGFQLYMDSAIVQAPGEYKWEVYLINQIFYPPLVTLEAIITFQVIQ